VVHIADVAPFSTSQFEPVSFGEAHDETFLWLAGSNGFGCGSPARVLGSGTVLSLTTCLLCSRPRVLRTSSRLLSASGHLLCTGSLLPSALLPSASLRRLAATPV